MCRASPGAGLLVERAANWSILLGDLDPAECTAIDGDSVRNTIVANAGLGVRTTHGQAVPERIQIDAVVPNRRIEIQMRHKLYHRSR
jgi:hypothetical protein